MKNWLAFRKLVSLSYGNKRQEERKRETKYLRNHQRKGNVLTQKGEFPGTLFLWFVIFEARYFTFLGQVRCVTCLEVMQLLSHRKVTLQKHKLGEKWPCFPWQLKNPKQNLTQWLHKICRQVNEESALILQGQVWRGTRVGHCGKW